MRRRFGCLNRRFYSCFRGKVQEFEASCSFQFLRISLFAPEATAKVPHRCPFFTIGGSDHLHPPSSLQKGFAFPPFRFVNPLANFNPLLLASIFLPTQVSLMPNSLYNCFVLSFLPFPSLLCGEG